MTDRQLTLTNAVKPLVWNLCIWVAIMLLLKTSPGDPHVGHSIGIILVTLIQVSITLLISFYILVFKLKGNLGVFLGYVSATLLLPLLGYFILMLKL